MASSMRGLIMSGADIDKNDEEFYLRNYGLYPTKYYENAV